VSALILACATVAVLLRGGDKNGDPVRLECVDPLVCGVLALEPAPQWTPTASATAEPPGDASAQAEGSESPGDPQGAAGLEPGRAPGRNAEGTLGEPPGDWAAKWYWPPEEWANLWALIQCESGGNPKAVSPDGQNWGLTQLNVIHRARAERLGYSWAQMLDPVANLRVAYDLWLDQGWGPWACKQ